MEQVRDIFTTELTKINLLIDERQETETKFEIKIKSLKEENEKTKKYARVINFIIFNLLIKLITLYKVIINKMNLVFNKIIFGYLISE